MTDLPPPSFDARWAKWLADLDDLEAAASTPAERANVLRAKQALDDVDAIALLCHDVKDPLASLLMGTALLSKKPRDADAVLATIGSAARRLDRIVTGANELALLRRGAFPVRLRPVPIVSLVTTVVENHRKTTDIHIDLEVIPASVTVLGDPMATSRIVSELLHNATGFSNGGGTVRVRIVVDGESVLVLVSDDGPGIDEAHLPHVFNEARNRSHKPRRGAGRGLPIAQALAELQKATLSVARREPTGCEARIQMQLASRSVSPQS